MAVIAPKVLELNRGNFDTLNRAHIQYPANKPEINKAVVGGLALQRPTNNKHIQYVANKQIINRVINPNLNASSGGGNDRPLNGWQYPLNK